jgi:CDP-diacylglycerol--glycerol-3-phosphate 3-phosphatidyltransferase
VPEIHLDVVPLLEPERPCAFVSAVTEQRRRRQNVAAPRLAPRDAFELAQLLERVDAHVRIGPDADADRALAHTLDRQEAVAEARFRRGARTDACAGPREQIELIAVRVRRMDDRRALGETAGAIEQLDRPEAVLGETLLDLARLLVCVHVQRQALVGRVAPDRLEPPGRACAYGVRCDTNGDAAPAERLDLLDVLVHRVLPEAGQTAALVGREQQHDPYPRLLGGVHCRERLGQPEVVELADGRVAGVPELTVDLDVLPADERGCLVLGLRQHQLPPRPEVAALATASQGALEGVTVGVDESRQAEALGHGRILSTPMASRAVSAPLQQLPNALTVFRLALIPVFIALMASAEGGHSWAAGIVFGIAGITDQVDGFLARRWHVESEFGRIFDPLADRLMIDAAVIMLFIADHMPLAGLIVILGRDVLLLLGYKAIAPQGYELRVNFLGKAATWLLYAGISFLLVTSRSTHWPYWIFWAGLILAVLAAVLYAVAARRELKR